MDGNTTTILVAVLGGLGLVLAAGVSGYIAVRSHRLERQVKRVVVTGNGTEAGDYLKRIDSTVEKLDEKTDDLKVGQARLEERIVNNSKRIDRLDGRLHQHMEKGGD